jgi:phage shock protein PspC (stress-responsive transcriptional regulator)
MTLILAGPRFRDRPGVFPMVRPAARTHAGAMDTTTSSAASEQTSHAPHDDSRPAQTLGRPVHDRMLAGVAAGIARYLNVDVTVVRILFAVLAVVGGAALPIYLAGWLLIPEDGADQSIAAGWFQPRTN